MRTITRGVLCLGLLLAREAFAQSVIITPAPGGTDVSAVTAESAATTASLGQLVINVKAAPYSATGDGTTNDRAAIDAAATASSTGAMLYFPRGTYAVASNWTSPAGVVLQFAAGAILKPASAVVITISGPVVAPATQIFDTSAAGSFALLRQNTQVDWFGADPTGVADSSVAITAAVAALTAGQGGIVQFSSGKYFCNVTLTGAMHGITLRGTGAYPSATAKGTQLLTNSTTLDVLKIAPSAAAIQEVVIENLFIKGDTAGTTGHGLFIDATAQTISKVRVSHVVFQNAKENNLYLKAGQGAGGFLFDVEIENIKAIGSDVGISILGRVSQVTILKPYISATTSAIDINGGTSSAEASTFTITTPVLATAINGLNLKDCLSVVVLNLYTEGLTTRQVWLRSARGFVLHGGEIKQTGTAKGIEFDVSADTSSPNDHIEISAPRWTNTSDKTLITYTGGTSTDVHFGMSSGGPITRANVTGTESGANQFKFDYQFHNTVYVGPNGNLLGPTGTISAPTWSTDTDSDTGAYSGGANDWRIAAGGADTARFLTTTMTICATCTLGWGSTGVSSSDTFLVRRNANNVGLRNTTNQQTFTVFRSFTDASNYFAGYLTATATEVRLGVDTAGTGSDDGDIVLIPAGAGGVKLNTKLWASIVAPTIASGGCTSPAMTSTNGTAAFKVTIGTACTGVQTITLTFPAATVGWACHVVNQTAPQTYVPVATTTSTTAVVVTNYSRTTGLAADYVASEVLVGQCSAL